jgi:hypothetical protein
MRTPGNDRMMKMTANRPPAQNEGWLPTGRLWRLSGMNEKKWGERRALLTHFARQRVLKSNFQASFKSRPGAVPSDILELHSVFFFARQRNDQLFTADII